MVILESVADGLMDVTEFYMEFLDKPKFSPKFLIGLFHFVNPLPFSILLYKCTFPLNILGWA